METIAIVGVGLIGGSFGLALRRAGFKGKIFGVSSPASIQAALVMGAIDAPISLREAAQTVDVLYLSQPINQILETITVLAPDLHPGALITDAGSTKQVIVKRAEEAGIAEQFLGGHPMAGKEKRGVQAADAELFAGRPYVLTPTTSGTTLHEELKSWITAFGAQVVTMSPENHDSTVASTSHLPQLISTALALTLADDPNPFASNIFGPGLIDMTRLALSSPDVWMSVLDTNRPAVRRALTRFVEYLGKVEIALDKHSDLEQYFSSASEYASRIRK
jgi:prephenate dehydrogenase